MARLPALRDLGHTKHSDGTCACRVSCGYRPRPGGPPGTCPYRPNWSPCSATTSSGSAPARTDGCSAARTATPSSPSTWWQVWRKVRRLALTPGQLATPLMRPPYDLRHSGITWRLNSGVPATEIAAWAGHSVEMLMRVYARCVVGLEDVWIARMDATLRPPDGQPGGAPDDRPEGGEPRATTPNPAREPAIQGGSEAHPAKPRPVGRGAIGGEHWRQTASGDAQWRNAHDCPIGVPAVQEGNFAG
jgi:hypothetical protein